MRIMAFVLCMCLMSGMVMAGDKPAIYIFETEKAGEYKLELDEAYIIMNKAQNRALLDEKEHCSEVMGVGVVVAGFWGIAQHSAYGYLTGAYLVYKGCRYLYKKVK